VLSEAPGVRLDIPEIGCLLLIRSENLTTSPVPPEPEPEPEIESSASEPKLEENLSIQSNAVSTNQNSGDVDKAFSYLRRELRQTLTDFFKGETKKLHRFVESLELENVDYDGLYWEQHSAQTTEKIKKDSPSDKIKGLIEKIDEMGKLEFLKNKFDSFVAD